MTAIKRKLYFYNRLGQRVPSWAMAAVTVVLAGASIYALRQNNVTMLKLREQVYVADESATNPEAVETALRELRQYVYGHMNTNLSGGELAIRGAPIQLSGTYQRAYDAEKERVSRVNASIYTEAQAECEKQFPIGLSGSGRIPCVEQYVASRGEKAREIPKAVYTFDFVSPRWSPDLAGILVLATGLMALGTVIHVLVGFFVARYLRHKYAP